ncbi:hypothetical protein HD553DRAFT_43800 [Filobasidium floriforme]|uniref:uncharacterized protein n=1 Tax=Filobasidium floriforme TaxID=5210 RepID=UPI001E8EA047|nr:uncharacterized protein HD553DRAFT_43800 [Filobasidium floriforme]KAH8084210.1 hypothetical protein HD553DRAFT_43800 [Filobasidium floriforme]
MPLSIDFSGKLVLITGGGRGIGLAITEALAEAGADIAITYTSTDATPVASQLSSKHGVTVKAFKCNVDSSAEIDKLVGDVQEAFGREVDIGVNNAGIALWQSSVHMTDNQFDSIFRTNTTGPYYLSRALMRSWLGLPISLSSSSSEVSLTADDGQPKKNLKGKQILFVSSISGLVAMTPQYQAAYNASKAGVTMLAKSLAAEWAPYEVVINSVSPGYVSTDMIANPPDEQARGWVKVWEERTPIGRFASAEEIGKFIAVLLSQHAAGAGFMTGSDVVIDGGYTLY